MAVVGALGTGLGIGLKSLFEYLTSTHEVDSEIQIATNTRLWERVDLLEERLQNFTAKRNETIDLYRESQKQNALLKQEVEQLKVENQRLKEQNQHLKDENARLKKTRWDDD